MVKKKTMALLFVGMALALTGCGENDAALGASESAGIMEEATASEPSSEDFTEDTTSGSIDEDFAEETTNESNSEDIVKDKVNVVIDNFKTDATIDETILIDQDDIKITATELTYTTREVQIKLTIENNSDKDLSFISNSYGYSCNSVNGYMIADGYFNTTVMAGKKTNETVGFSISALQAYGISEVADIQIGIYTSDDEYNHVYYEPANITTSSASDYDYSIDYYKNAMVNGILEELADCSIDYWDDSEYYNQSSVAIESVALVTDYDNSQSLFVECANDAEQLINVEISNIAINGLVLNDGTWSSDTINVGAKAIITVTLNDLIDDNYWDIIGLGEVASLNFDIELTDMDSNELSTSENVEITISEDNPYVVNGTTIYDGDGVKLTYLGIVVNESSYSDDYHLLLVVENETSDTIMADCAYDSFSTNGYMMDFYCYGVYVPAESKALFEITVDEDSLADAGITDISDIEETEFVFEVKDLNYKKMIEENVYLNN